MASELKLGLDCSRSRNRVPGEPAQQLRVGQIAGRKELKATDYAIADSQRRQQFAQGLGPLPDPEAIRFLRALALPEFTPLMRNDKQVGDVLARLATPMERQANRLLLKLHTGAGIEQDASGRFLCCFTMRLAITEAEARHHETAACA